MSKKDFPEPIVVETPTDLPTSPDLPKDEMIFLGRRAEFGNATIGKMKEYLDRPLFEDITDLDGKLIKRVPTEMPSIAGLAIEIGVHRRTIHNWIKRYNDFENYIELLKQKQERWLLYHGLNKNIDGNFAKFVAINVTEMSDKKEHAIKTEKIEINIDRDDAEL